MNHRIFGSDDASNHAAADLLADWLTAPGAANVLVAAGNTPLPLYDLIAARGLPLEHLRIFALDEYVGVPPDEPRNCANLLRDRVVDAWRVPRDRYSFIRSEPNDALESVRKHEACAAAQGGLDIAILGLGPNGHLGFNEPGARADSLARVVSLERSSIEANRRWFNGAYAPAAGATLGLRTILAARHILLLAYGPHKADAVAAMLEGPVDSRCPASFLRDHADAWVFLDEASSARLTAEFRMANC